MVGTVFSDIKTTRGRQDMYNALRAIAVLNYAPPYHWLVATEEEVRTESAPLRLAILAELGRIKDRDDLKEWARVLCRRKPKAKAAVAMIRRWRLDRAPKVDCLTLTDAIIGFVNDYLATHPDVTRARVLMALENARDAFGGEDDSEAASEIEGPA
jgi:hypothetical protein